MAHPIKELAKLTAKSKQIDGMGFSGEAPDNLEVAAMLAMANPDTGKKLNRHAYYLARFIYADDKYSGVQVKSGVLSIMVKSDLKIPEVGLWRLINCAVKEIRSPVMRLNRETGEMEIRPTSKREICRRLGIKNGRLPTNIDEAYSAILQQLFEWNSEALRHISATMDDEAA
tara:strand:+ start:9781 stop:10296 length:516 start_codon:yes stop_codon:yes gene_type:complete